MVSVTKRSSAVAARPCGEKRKFTNLSLDQLQL
jgi:hypothetical protein